MKLCKSNQFELIMLQLVESFPNSELSELLIKLD